MKFASQAAFHYLLYHDILQLQKDSKDKTDQADRWYHCKCRLGPLLFTPEGLLLARVGVWNVYDSGPPDHNFREEGEPSCSLAEHDIRETLSDVC